MWFEKKIKWFIINHTLILEVFIFSHILTHWSCTLTPDIAIFEVLLFFITLKKFVDVIHPIWQKTECSELCLLGANIESVTDYPKKEKNCWLSSMHRLTFHLSFKDPDVLQSRPTEFALFKNKVSFSLCKVSKMNQIDLETRSGEQLSRNIRTK